ncbi:MAG: hypothetical protein ABSG97_07435, partial [Sedimentisphaerales bacterium]
MQTASITSVFAFNYGDQVQSTTNGLNIHSSDTLSSSVIDQANLGDKGAVHGGPYYDSASGYTFYYIAWVTHSAGYSVQNYLQLATSPAPSINSVSPTSMTADNTLHSFKVYGSNFDTSSSHLLFTDPQGNPYTHLLFTDPQGNPYTSANHSSYENRVSTSEFDYQLNNNSDAGTWTVKVQNPDGQTSAATNFTVTAVVPAPSISSVSPTSMTADNTLHSFKVYGSNFDTSSSHLLFTDPQGNPYT